MDSNRYPGRRIGHVVGLDLATLVGCRDNQAEVFEACQAFNDSWARQLGPLHEQIEADRHAAVWYATTSLNDGEIDLDRIATNSSKITAVEENGLYPIVSG